MRYVVFGFFGASIGVAIGIVGGLLLPPLFYSISRSRGYTKAASTLSLNEG